MTTFNLRMREAKTIRKRKPRRMEFCSYCNKRIMKLAKPIEDGKKLIIGFCSNCKKERFSEI